MKWNSVLILGISWSMHDATFSFLGWQSHDMHLGKQLQLQGVYFWGQFKSIQLQQEFLEDLKSVAQSGRVCQVKGINQSHEQWASSCGAVAPWQNLMAFDKDGDINWILISTVDDEYFEDVVTDITPTVLLHTTYNKKECYWETNNRIHESFKSDFIIMEEWTQEYVCSFFCFPLNIKLTRFIKFIFFNDLNHAIPSSLQKVPHPSRQGTV